MSYTTITPRLKISLGVFAVILIAVIVWLSQTNPHPPKPWMKQAAIDIAWTELIKHYPDGKKLGVAYALYDVRPLPDKGPNVWEVTYDLPDGVTDQTIWITVDIGTKKVLLFDKAQA